MKYIITKHQYRLLTEENTTLLSEGRKDELIAKYKQKFKEYPSVISDVLNNDVITRKNYKYADFLLKNLHPNSDEYEISDAIALINKFDKNLQNLEKRDINQYNDLEDLENSVNLYLVSKDPKAEIEKIYEDDRFLVIIPKNKTASCKYGANTKWCVTMKDFSHYESYTSGNQFLYFIIDKKNSTDTDFSKVAIHVTNQGFFTYYDSQDKSLTDKEIKILRYAFPDVINSIKDDYYKKISEKKSIDLWDVFSEENYDSNFLRHIISFDKTLVLKISGFDIAGTGHANADLDIFSYSPLDSKSNLIDKYDLFVTYVKLSDKTLGIEVNIEGWDTVPEDNFMDLGLHGETLRYYPIQFENTESATAKKIRQIILGEIKELISSILGEINQ